MNHSWRTAIIALALTPTLAIAGCTSSSGDDTGKLPTGAEDSYWTNGVRPAPSDPARNNGGIASPPVDSSQFCNDPELGSNNKRDAFCNSVPWYDPSLPKKLNYKPGRAPHSTTYNGRVNVESFLLAAMRSQRDTWRSYFNSGEVTVPSFGSVVVSGSEKFKSSCPIDLVGDSQTVTVTATSARVLYCPSASNRDDQIAFPVNTVARLWKDHDRKTADMAAAIVASRAGGLMLNRALAKRQGGSVLDPYLGSSCLAGVWARGAYPRSSESDLDRALNYARRVVIEIGNGTDPSSEDLDLAWFQGYQSGDANTCSDSADWLKNQFFGGSLRDGSTA